MNDTATLPTEEIKARRDVLGAKAAKDSSALTTEQWDEFFALGRELQKRLKIKAAKEDSGPAP